MAFASFASFIEAMKSLDSPNPLTIYRAHRNPFHIVLLFIYYLLLPVIWIVRAIRGVAIRHSYLSAKPRIETAFPLQPKTSANTRDDLPPPLAPRKRSLTLPLPDEKAHGHRHRHRTSKQATFLQHHSPLFVKFPAEVRRMVYLQVILLPGRGELCVSHAERRLYGFPAMERDEENPDLLGYPHSAWVGLDYAGRLVGSIRTVRNSRPSKDLLGSGSRSRSEYTENSRPDRLRVVGLLTSCRRMYVCIASHRIASPILHTLL
jgi:hypothetical protein